MSIDFHAEGFTPPKRRPLGREGKAAALAETLATLGLVVCIFIAATAVSAGIARADALGVTPFKSGVAIAVLLGLLFAGVAGMAAGMAELRRPRDF